MNRFRGWLKDLEPEDRKAIGRDRFPGTSHARAEAVKNTRGATASRWTGAYRMRSKPYRVRKALARQWMGGASAP
jgi:hypothetical protein